MNDTKCLLKVEAISICFDNNLFFSSNIIISCILLFLFENYGLHAFKNVLEIQSTLSFSKYFNLVCLFRFQIFHQVLLSLKLDNVNSIFWLIAFVLRRYLIIFRFQRILLEWAFWFLYKSFVFLGMLLYRTETKLFSKSAWALVVDILLQISNLNWSQWICLQL